MQAAARSRGVRASALVIEALDRLGAWTTPGALADALSLPVPAVQALLDGLHAQALIEYDEAGSGSADATGAPSPAWDVWAPAARLFHLATRDVAFTRARANDHEPADGIPTSVADPRPPAVLPSRGGPSTPLPAPSLADVPLRAALSARRTHRRFADAGIAAAALGTLLGVTFGVQAWAHADEGPLALKTSPSGGARHSLEAYVWARRVEGVASGLHHYQPGDHALTWLGPPPADDVTRWLPAQDGYAGASVVVVVASVVARVAWRYRSARALRVVLIEAGHLGQTFCLTAAGLGLAPFCTGALADSRIEADLGLDVFSQPVCYAMGAGPRPPGPWQPHADRPAPPLEITALGRAWP